MESTSIHLMFLCEDPVHKLHLQKHFLVIDVEQSVSYQASTSPRSLHHLYS